MKINTLYNLQQKVYIKTLKIWGKVTAFYIDCGYEVQYSVRYFYEFKPQSCYFHDDELSLQEEDVVVGFVK